MTHLSASVVPTQGFHAVLSTHITGPAPRNCSLNLSVILPPDCVLDPHELALQEREPALHVTVVGISELERPMHAVKPEHTQLLINAYFLDSETSENLSMTIDVPIHMRYPAPDVSASSLANVTIPWPTAYWNCTNTDISTSLSYALGDSGVDTARTDAYTRTLVPVAGAFRANEIEVLTLSSVFITVAYAVLMLWSITRWPQR